MRYLVLPFVLVLGIVELMIRLTALACLLPLTFLVGVFAYVDDHPQDFRDLLEPVCFKLADKLVA